jgi:hypothetical protein
VGATLLLLALAGGAGEAGSGELERYLQAALHLYQQLENERALEQLGHARELIGSPDEEVRVSLVEGVVLSDAGRRKEAESAFRTALSLDPEATLPLKAPPKVAELFEDLREQARKTAPRPAPRAVDAPDVARPASDRAPVAPPPAPPPSSPPPLSASALPWVLGASGILFAGGSVWCWFEARGRYQTLTAPAPTGAIDAPTEARLAAEGEAFQAAAFTALGLGAAALVASGALFWIGSRVRVSVGPWAGGGALIFAGVLP